ncbi:hypothetical protein ACJ72_01365 [Emergomyces africanus]|uniref:Uncharacterized protein n=1 Tax=Emergomyces africanus TaxID=1955775 RepID=A0A1B7P5H7_9EURO|nr:hypothetical protein ACJ72_01365 [Emergomyces africanus]
MSQFRRRQPSEDSLHQRQPHLQHHQPHQPHPYNYHHHHQPPPPPRQQHNHHSNYTPYTPYTPYTYSPYSPPSPSDPQQREAAAGGAGHSFNEASSPLMPISLIPRDYLTQHSDAANPSAGSSSSPLSKTNSNNSSNFSNFSHSDHNFRSQAPVLPPIRTTTTEPSTATLYRPRTRPPLPSSLSPSSFSSSSQPHGCALTPQSPSLNQEDSPVSISPTSTTPRAPCSAISSNSSPSPPLLPPLSASTFTQVSAFPVPPKTTTFTVATTTSSSIEPSTTDRIQNQSPEALKYHPAPPDRLAGSSQLRGANGNMPKSSSYDVLRKASDPPRPVTMNSNNNNNINTINNRNTNNNNIHNINNNGVRRVTSPNSVSPSPSLSNPALSSAVGDRIRTMPRTSSIDSAISSISSAHSHKSSPEANNVTSEDIANLISTAGSAEAVIIHLLKEKQQAASQNAQLWRLVDKQRTMVLGLNKDLERAMKDKERYRKKLKELQTNQPPIPERTVVDGEPASEGDNNSSKETASGHDRTKQSDAAMRSSLDEPAMLPSHSHLSHSHTNPQLIRGGTPSSRPSSPSDIARAEQPAVNNYTNHHLRDSPTDSFMHEKQREQAKALENRNDNKNEINTPDPKLKNALPANLRAGGPDPQKQAPPPLRRPPPAPLNLSQTERNHVQSQRANVAVGDDSDYGDTLETDGIPRMENRGRRKTREEDDREREALLLQEKAARSASSKMKAKVMQPPEGAQKPHQPTQGFGGNRIVAHSPPPGLSQQISPLDSLASMLSLRLVKLRRLTGIE